MNLNILPDLALAKIFDNSTLIDLFKKRRVCKRWKLFVDLKLKRIDELNLFFDVPIQDKVFWEYNHQLINPYYSLSVSNRLFSYKRLSQTFNCVKIKKLLISADVLTKSLFKKINAFVHNLKENLEYLQINQELWYSRRYSWDNVSIEFKRLKTFHMNWLCFDIDTGNAMKFRNLEQVSTSICEINEKNIKWIKELKSLSYWSMTSNAFDFDFTLPNLEVLCFLTQSHSTISLSKLPSLKELHIFANWGSLNGLWNVVDYYLKGKKDLQMHDLKLFVRYFEYSEKLKNQRFLGEGQLHKDFYNVISDDFLNYYEKNYLNFKFTGTNLFSFDLNLTDSFLYRLEKMKELGRPLIENAKSCLIFHNLNYLHKTNIVLEKCSYIVLMGNISQSNLDSLPKICPKTWKIQLKGQNMTANIDLNFLSNFKEMRKICFENFDISSRELNKILDNCKFLRVGCFKRFTFSTNQKLNIYIRQKDTENNFSFKSKLDFMKYLKEYELRELNFYLNHNFKVKNKYLKGKIV